MNRQSSGGAALGVVLALVLLTGCVPATPDAGTYKGKAAVTLGGALSEVATVQTILETLHQGRMFRPAAIAQMRYSQSSYGNSLSVTWMVSYAALAALAAHPGTVRLLAGSVSSARADVVQAAGRGVSRTARLGLLLTAALLTVVLLYLHSPRSVFLLGAAMLAVTLVTYRTSLLAGDLYRERRLAAELDEAVGQLR